MVARPNQGPVAAFSFTAGTAGNATDFDGSTSSDSDGTVARYDWDFGDGNSAPDAGPTPSHTYATPGSYTATLTVTDDQGCSTSQVFTGQTVYCNGGAAARSSDTVVISAPPPPPDPPITPPPGAGANPFGGGNGNGGNGGNGGNVLGNGGNGGDAGPCGGGGGGGGGVGAGGGGAGGGGCFEIPTPQSLASGRIRAFARVATRGTTVRAAAFIRFRRGASRRAQAARAPRRWRRIGRTTRRNLTVGRHKITIRLSSKARRQLKRRRKVKVKLRLRMTAPTGKSLVVTRTVTLVRRGHRRSARRGG